MFHAGHGFAIIRIVEISRVDYPGLLIAILLQCIEMIPVVIIHPVYVQILGEVQNPGLIKGVMIHNGIWVTWLNITCIQHKTE